MNKVLLVIGQISGYMIIVAGVIMTILLLSIYI